MPLAESHAQGRLAGLLRSQGLNVLCAQAAVLLLAVGSVVLAATRDGASANVGMEDLRAFFSAPSWVHSWFYLLVAVLLLFALNTILSVWDNVLGRWRAGLRAPVVYAAAIIHVGFLVALAAHLVGGLWTVDRAPLWVTTAWRPLDAEQEIRLDDLQVTPLPDGSVEQVHARVTTRTAAGATATTMLRYNEPLSRGLGSELYLLARFQPRRPGVPPAVLLRPRQAPGNPLALTAAALMLLGLGLMWRRWLGPLPRQGGTVA